MAPKKLFNHLGRSSSARKRYNPFQNDKNNVNKRSASSGVYKSSSSSTPTKRRKVSGADGLDKLKRVMDKVQKEDAAVLVLFPRYLVNRHKC